MKNYIKILFSLVIITSVFAQQGRDDKEIKFNPRSKFFGDYLNFSSAEAGKTRLDPGRADGGHRCGAQGL